MKKIALLGSTGSIGRNCLKVIDRFPGEFQITCLAARRSVELLYQQARVYRPRQVVITGHGVNESLVRQIEREGIRILRGEEGLIQFLDEDDSLMVVNALVGAIGMLPTREALRRGKDVALANKESLVMAGELITKLAQQKRRSIIPIDSEHSAIFQCLVGEDRRSVRRVILTASGGPFWSRDVSSFKDITVQEALAHPSWNMGRKITIDSATLMNKGLEIIEAHWLFGLPLEKIEVVIHPQSIVHSLVEFIDGSIKAQMSIPDMRIPIQYALTYPERKIGSVPSLSLESIQQLDFFRPDYKKFPCLVLAIEALKKGGTAPAVLNAANEVAVQLFLKEQIRFNEIAQIVEETLESHRVISNPSLEDILESDRWARSFALKRQKKI